MNKNDKWVCIFPGKGELYLKLATDREFDSEKEAQEQASRNCNVVAIPLCFWEKIEEIQDRAVQAEGKLNEILLSISEFLKRIR